MENAEQNYADFLGMMRTEGAHDNPETLLIGTMLSSNSVEVDGLTLYRGDLYFADYLMEGFSYPLRTPYVYDSYFNRSSSAVRSTGLKKGDKVALMKCANNDTYVVLAKVVSA